MWGIQISFLQGYGFSDFGLQNRSTLTLMAALVSKLAHKYSINISESSRGDVFEARRINYMESSWYWLVRLASLLGEYKMEGDLLDRLL